MQFLSLGFLLFVVLSLPALHLAPSLSAKRAVLFGSNLGFVAFLTATPATMLPMALFVLGGFGLVRLVQAGRRRVVAAAAIVVAIATFVCLKQYAMPWTLPPLGGPYSVVGLSYVLFRVLHLLVDAFDGGLGAPISFLSFFNYCCFFPCWISGPLQRYDDYRAQELGLLDARTCAAEVHEALSRVVTGFFKIAVLSAVLLELHGQLAAVPLDGAYPLHFAVTMATAAALYTLYMYYNFAGYMDVVVGLGVCYGFRLPENFDHPFASKNFFEFWTRWHITLSNWFKVYLFNPILRALAGRWGGSGVRTYLGVAAYFVTFLMMGVWHGSTPVYVLYGLLLGGGVSGNKLYEIEAGRWLGKESFRRLRAHWFYAGLCRGAVFAYFTAALVCFWATPALGTQILAHPALAATTYAALTVVAAATLGTAGLGRATWDALARRHASRGSHALSGPMLLGLKTYAVALLILAKTAPVPTFVYAPF